MTYRDVGPINPTDPDDVPTVDSPVVMAYRSPANGTQALGIATTDALAFPTTGVDDGGTALDHDPVTNNSRITIIETGRYEVSYAVVSKNASVAVVDIEVFKNGDTGTPIPGSNAPQDIDDANEFENVRTFAIDLLGGDYIELYATSDIAGTTIEPETHLMAISMQGASGSQGTPGAGSQVIVEEGGVAVTNTPHDTLDFAGGDFDVVDNADGSATISKATGGAFAGEVDIGEETVVTTKVFQAVSFNFTFTSPPIVNATVSDTDSAGKKTSVRTVTTTGFDLYSEAANGDTVGWAAVLVI